MSLRCMPAHRANKPTLLLLLSFAILAGSAIFMLTSWSRLSDAR